MTEQFYTLRTWNGTLIDWKRQEWRADRKRDSLKRQGIVTNVRLETVEESELLEEYNAGVEVVGSV